jgi:hypothetical protein
MNMKDLTLMGLAIATGGALTIAVATTNQPATAEENKQDFNGFAAGMTMLVAGGACAVAAERKNKAMAVNFN